MRPVKRSSFASESSRSETSTLTRSGAASSAGKRLGERSRPAVVGVVEEVLLGLVEDEVDVAVGLRAARAPSSGATPFGAAARGLGDRLGERDGRIVAPAREDDDERLLGKLAQRACDGRAQERRLPDAARAVEHRQPRGDEVRDDDLALALAPEEEQRVELGVLEGVEPLVGRLGLSPSRRLEPPLEQLDVRAADRRRARRRRTAARTPARAGSASAAPPTSGTRPAARPRSG